MGFLGGEIGFFVVYFEGRQRNSEDDNRQQEEGGRRDAMILSPVGYRPSTRR
jgi:hypothetical protein